MADITDIKSIMYTEKSLKLQEENVLVVQTSPRVSKQQLKEVFKEYFGFTPLRVNSLQQDGKVKFMRTRSSSGKKIKGQRVSFKKFYVKLPEGARIESLAV
ncbi:MAG: 50S ribosomal protein L23 [Helicobacter sp.]|nr:50S ribosomal protein L23 [Helicobacter sp.]MDE6044778.1 50S ribosomal protein L23 [Helicobacter sp.]MDE7173683.1 50S ribosomal protein L23 [Helicobacter sp.]MDE7254603.1 50S ribosomal protein L23 [Helicobacter sp.]MDE7316742.1 50S ribosomal protein L23 [Helicobacter sp.]